MKHRFAKYQATRNDFILIDLTGQSYVYTHTLTQQLCHRQFGIGGDGIITIEKKIDFDFSMLHYDADGSPGGGLCGNGSRTALHYAQQLGFINQEACFMTIDGLHTGHVADKKVNVSIQDVHKIQSMASGYYLYNGTRHYIEIVEDVMHINMHKDGFPRGYIPPFEQEGVNLNFVEIQDNKIAIRTCECGLEVEPLSCGTGAIAAALVSSAYYGLQSPIEVYTRGGSLWVSFIRSPNGSFTNIYLIGFVNQTFSGIIDLNNVQDT